MTKYAPMPMMHGSANQTGWSAIPAKQRWQLQNRLNNTQYRLVCGWVRACVCTVWLPDDAKVLCKQVCRGPTRPGSTGQFFFDQNSLEVWTNWWSTTRYLQ